MPTGHRMYSDDFKYEVVKQYLEGDMGLRQLSNKYHIDRGDIQKWRDAYLEHGMEGLTSRHGTYSGDFKIAAVEYMQETGSSIRKTAAHFDIKSPRTLSQWERIYFEEGPDALREERRGRASKKGMIKKPRKKKNLNENEDLLAEVQRLRMENEYLKKLNALIQEREKSKKKTK